MARDLVVNDTPFLLVGLGNPGEKYKLTRHNIGFILIDFLVDRWKAGKSQEKFQGRFWKTEFNGRSVLLLQPETFMNLSGRSVREAVQFFKIDAAKDLMIISDDLDLPLGVLRLRIKGGSGGHNGLKSIIQELGGSEEFSRLRVGIGRDAKTDTSDFVLGKISKAEQKKFEDVLFRIAEGIETFLKGGPERAMEQINRKEKEEEAP